MDPGLMGQGTRDRDMEGPGMKDLNTRDRDMEVQPTRDRSMKVRHMVAHDTKARDTRDPDTEAPITMEPLVLVHCATPRRCPTQVPSRLLAVIALPTFLSLLRRQTLRYQGQLRRSIVYQTLLFLRITTHRLNNQSRQHERHRKYL